MSGHRVKLDPTTYRPRYQQLGIMEQWCEQHAPGAWSHPTTTEHWNDDGETLSWHRPLYDEFLFESPTVAMLFKLTFWKAQ